MCLEFKKCNAYKYKLFFANTLNIFSYILFYVKILTNLILKVKLKNFCVARRTNFLSYLLVCMLNIFHHFLSLTRTKTSIRYAKENGKKKREGRKERERRVEGEI